MRNLLTLLMVLFAASALRADVVCGTWNLRWFPSGRAEHRAAPAIEAATTRRAARAISGALDAVDPSGRTGVILFLEELRNGEACSNLVAALARTNLSVAAASAFRERDNRLGWQQCGIATSLPVLEGAWTRWRRARQATPPRGYAYALLDGGPDGLILCFCVHLKSNYGASSPDARALDAAKREAAARELAETVAQRTQGKRADGRKIVRVIVAGDFNTDVFDPEFAGERTIPLLLEAGFVNGCAAADPADRATHPGHGQFPDSTLDYVLFRGLAAPRPPRVFNGAPVSDHDLVLVRLRAP